MAKVIEHDAPLHPMTFDLVRHSTGWRACFDESPAFGEFAGAIVDLTGWPRSEFCLNVAAAILERWPNATLVNIRDR